MSDRSLTATDVGEIEIGSFALSNLPCGVLLRGRLRCNIGLDDPVELPVLVVRGESDSPVLLVAAGVHGNEYEGMEAIRHVWRDLDPSRMSGTFVGLPICNPMAFEARSRETPSSIDGLNLARVFPGNQAGSPTERLASELLDLLERLVGPEDLFVDLHSGTGEVAFASMAGFRDVDSPSRVRSEEAARQMGLPRLWAIPDASGPFNAETARRGIPTVGTETTGRAGCQPDDVAAYATALHNLLGWLGISTTGSPPARSEQAAKPTIDLIADVSGFARVHVHLDDDVLPGQVLCTIIDDVGVTIGEIRAPISGTIWAVRETPRIERGELAFMVAS